MLPGMQGWLVAETEDYLEFVAVAGRREDARAKVAGEVGGQLFAFMQPGQQVLVAAMGGAARHHQGDGWGRHRVSPGNGAGG